MNLLEIVFTRMLVMFITCSFYVKGSTFIKDKYLLEKKNAAQRGSQLSDACVSLSFVSKCWLLNGHVTILHR